MSQPALILFAHGARDPQWAGPLRRLAAQLAELAPDARVELAFLEFMTPTLDVAIDTLVGEGRQRLRVIPVFLAQGGHLKRDVPVLIDTARARHPGVEIALSQAIGEEDAVIRAMAECVLAQAGN